MCVVSKAEELTGEPADSIALWLDVLHPLVIKLKRCIEVMCSRATVGLTFFALQVTSFTFWIFRIGAQGLFHPWKL